MLPIILEAMGRYSNQILMGRLGVFSGYKWGCSASLVDSVDLGFDSELHNVIQPAFEVTQMGFIILLLNGCCNK